MIKQKTEQLLKGVDYTPGTPIDPSPHCVAPFKSITINPNGDVFPDSVYNTPLGNLHQQSLKEIWYGDAWTQLRNDQINKTLNQGCVDCAKKEHLVGHSRRRFFNTFFMYRLPKKFLEPITDAKGYNLSLRPSVKNYNDPDFLYLDISTSNKCNLKCIHCRGAVSTGWIPDEKKLAQSSINDLRSSNWGVYTLDDELIDKIFEFPEYYQNLRYLALRGGEPTYEQRNKTILKKLIDLKWSRQITVDISTNATVNDDEFLNLLDQFEGVMLYISIEGVGDMYDYCRGDKQHKITDLEKMIFKYANLKNSEICITFTTMATNVFNIRPTWEWMQKYRDYCTFSFSNTVSQPDYLSFAVLNDEMKKQAYDMISDIKEDLYWPGDFDRTYQPGIDRIKENLSKPQEIDWNKHFINFKRYLKELDAIRNTDFLSVEPQYEKFWEL